MRIDFALSAIPIRAMGIDFAVRAIPIRVMRIDFAVRAIPIRVMRIDFAARAIPIRVMRMGLVAINKVHLCHGPDHRWSHKLFQTDIDVQKIDLLQV